MTPDHLTVVAPGLRSRLRASKLRGFTGRPVMLMLAASRSAPRSSSGDVLYHHFADVIPLTCSIALAV